VKLKFDMPKAPKLERKVKSIARVDRCGICYRVIGTGVNTCTRDVKEKECYQLGYRRLKKLLKKNGIKV